MALIWVITITIVVVGFLLQYSWPSKKLPPGPKGFPLLGSLHLLGTLPHRNLHKLSQKYGPIMSIKLGLVPAVVASSPRAAELFLKTHDLVFASRPSSEAAKHLSYRQKNLAFAPYGPFWRNMRKMCTLELLSNFKINSFRSLRKQELGLLVGHIRGAARDRDAVNLSKKVTALTTDMTCLMTFGKKYEDREIDERGFKAVIHEGMKLSAAPNLGDFIPCIAWLDLQGLTRRMKAIHKVYDEFLERIINEHLEAKDGKPTKDFVDVMLELIDSQQSEYQIDRFAIKAILLDIFAAAVDTSSTTIEWAMSELIRHPQIMKKLQDELQNAVGLHRVVEESDLEHLNYLDMVVKEILRLHPPGPILIPHESLEDCTVDDFHIPKKTRILVNVWAIGRDSSAWIDSEKFFPERFIGSQLDVKGKDFQLIPFGAGRRGCPGMQLGLTVVRLVLAQLVHCFDWELPNGMLPSELDMTEEFGLTCPRVQNLMVVPIYRLCNYLG